MTDYGKSSKTNIDLDIRFFRRYPKEIPFSLTIKDRTFKAKTVDYSLIGVGILVNDPDAPLNKGDLIDLDFKELNLCEKAEAAWVVKTPSGLRVGVHRIEPLKGNFNIYPVPDILIGLQRTLKTGVLEVTYRSLKENLFIKNGNITFAESNYEKDRLVDVLLKSRRIDRKQYNKTEEMKIKSGSPYAEILLHMRYIKPQDLIYARELQAKRIIKRLFLMKDAEFEFREGPFSPMDIPPIKLSVSDFVYREVKKNADVDLLESYLLENIVDFSSNPLNLFQKIHFNAFDKSVISCVDGKRSIRDIIKLSVSAGRVNPLKVIYALLETRFLKISGKYEAPTGMDAKEIFEGQRGSDSKLSDEIEVLYSKYETMDYYKVLGIKQGATAEQIKKAYYSAAKKYHPDKHLQLQKDAKSKLTELFTYITNAYLTLTNDQRRKDYDACLLPEKEKSQKSPDSQMSGLSAIRKDVQSREYDTAAQSEQTKSTGNAEIAKQRFRDGKTAFWDKNFNEAARLFAAAVYYAPSVAEYHYFYGSALLSLDSPKKAVQALNRAYELKPLDADIIADLGHAYLQLNLPLRAQNFFNKALKSDPYNKRAKTGLQMLGKK